MSDIFVGYILTTRWCVHVKLQPRVHDARIGRIGRRRNKYSVSERAESDILRCHLNNIRPNDNDSIFLLVLAQNVNLVEVAGGAIAKRKCHVDLGF